MQLSHEEVLLQPPTAKTPEGSALIISAPGMSQLKVSLAPPSPCNEQLTAASVWEWKGLAADEGEKAAAWFSEYLDKPCRLVRYIGWVGGQSAARETAAAGGGGGGEAAAAAAEGGARGGQTSPGGGTTGVEGNTSAVAAAAAGEAAAGEAAGTLLSGSSEDKTFRAPNAEFCPDASVAFADVFPLLVVSEVRLEDECKYSKHGRVWTRKAGFCHAVLNEEKAGCSK